jgi:hypothetical protein
MKRDAADGSLVPTIGTTIFLWLISGFFDALADYRERKSRLSRAKKRIERGEPLEAAPEQPQP